MIDAQDVECRRCDRCGRVAPKPKRLRAPRTQVCDELEIWFLAHPYGTPADAWRVIGGSISSATKTRSRLVREGRIYGIRAGHAERHARCREYILEHPDLTQAQIAEHLCVPQHAVHHARKTLRAEGLIGPSTRKGRPRPKGAP